MMAGVVLLQKLNIGIWSKVFYFQWSVVPTVWYYISHKSYNNSNSKINFVSKNSCIYVNTRANTCTDRQTHIQCERRIYIEFNKKCLVNLIRQFSVKFYTSLVIFWRFVYADEVWIRNNSGFDDIFCHGLVQYLFYFFYSRVVFLSLVE